MTNGIKIIVKPKWTLGETKNYATIYLTAPQNADTYSVNITGVVSLNKKYYPAESSTVSQLDVLSYIEPEVITVTVNKEQSVSGGSSNHGTSHTPAGSGGGSKGSGGNVPVVKPIEPVNPPQDAEVSSPKEIFNDLANVEWAKESIYTLLEKGIIAEADNFYPDRNITREEFVKMLVIALGKYDESAKSDFNDIDNNAWYAAYVASAKDAGIVSGDDENNFGVGREITRQDMSVMIYRALNLLTTDSAEKFSDDADISDYAKDAVYKMRTLGIINGVGDNMFAPKIPASRAMAAKIIGAMLMEVAQ